MLSHIVFKDSASDGAVPQELVKPCHFHRFLMGKDPVPCWDLKQTADRFFHSYCLAYLKRSSYANNKFAFKVAHISVFASFLCCFSFALVFVFVVALVRTFIAQF